MRLVGQYISQVLFSVSLLLLLFLLFVAHTTQFTKPGDVYLLVGSGSGHLNSGGSYVSIMDPDTKDLTIIIETMVYNTLHAVLLHSLLYRVMIIQSVYDLPYLLITLLSKLLLSR